VLRRKIWVSDEVATDWRRLQNEALHIIYGLPNTIKVIKSRSMRWAGHVVHMGEMRNSYKILVGKPKGKSPLGKLRHKREGNIKVDLKEIGRDGVDWIYLVQGRDQRWDLVNTVTRLGVAQKVENFFTS
jgi:hypothetical protein